MNVMPTPSASFAFSAAWQLPPPLAHPPLGEGNMYRRGRRGRRVKAHITNPLRSRTAVRLSCAFALPFPCMGASVQALLPVHRRDNRHLQQAVQLSSQRIVFGLNLTGETHVRPRSHAAKHPRCAHRG